MIKTDSNIINYKNHNKPECLLCNPIKSCIDSNGICEKCIAWLLEIKK